jgi:gluconate 2-dehydrogenase gamma chain
MEYLDRKALIEAGVQLTLSKALAELATRATPRDMDGVFKRQLPPAGNYFTDNQRRLVDAVQMLLFPADGDGPSARDLNSLPYLEWAITDPTRMEDGDPSFITKGIAWLEEKSYAAHAVSFLDLTSEVQNEFLKQMVQSKFGKNWLSLLLFYLTEALMLDPYYGGNPDMTAWLWLDHRPGFPRPVEGKSYRDFN